MNLGNSTNQNNISGSSNGRPLYGIGDWINLLLREFWLMLAVFLLICLLGLAYAMTLQKKYTAQARISVLVGDEYVYSPRVGAAGVGASPKQEQIVQSEVEVITSAQVSDRVVAHIGPKNLYSSKELVAHGTGPIEEQYQRIAVENFRKEFGASATPNTTVIKLSYANHNPKIAADALNKLIDEYLLYRKEVLFENRAGVLGKQKTEFNNELDAVQAQIESLLTQNGVADYESEKNSVFAQLSLSRQELLNTQSRLSEAIGRSSATNSSYSREPSQVRLSFESDNTRRKIDLEQQMAELLTKYTEQSQPVQELQKRINAIDSVISSEAGRNAGLVKTGPNPVRDSIATDRSRNTAEVIALRNREAVLISQLQQVQSRAEQIAQMRPLYEDLLRKKLVLEEQVKQFASKEAEALALNNLQSNLNENIRVIERAIPPSKGTSMKSLIMLGSILFGGFTALVAGAMRALTRSRFPSKSSISRTLGLPILATVSR